MRQKKVLYAALALSTLVGVSACGGSSDTSTEGGSTELTGRGPITLVQGKDTSGFVQDVLDEWNKEHPDEKVTLVELPEDADSQRQQMIQNAQTESDEYDVLVVDVVWNAEFAANKYIAELPEEEFPTDQMFGPTLDTAKYYGKLYSIPQASDGGLLYYRKDLLEAAGIDAPPETWAEMEDQCKQIQATPEGKGVGCYAGQFDKYEGLTVNAAEAINGAGGEIIGDDGKPNVDTPEAAEGLDFLASSFDSGLIPKQAITYQEEEGRRAFQAGNLIFHRQWPYQYALANATDGSSKVAGKFEVAPLPGMDGPGVSSLGGHNMAISTYSKHQQTAMDFIKFYTSPEQARKQLEMASLAPIYTDIYEDPELQKKFPFLPTLKDSILSAEPRPKVVNYGDATIAIQDAAYAALQGDMSSEEAVAQMQTELEEVTKK
ncbi:MAG: ABC transporter substrate-binding protein [Nocardioidaceae bacterium]